MNFFQQNKGYNWLITGITILFIIVSAVSIYHNWYYILLLPVGILFLYLSVTAVDKLLLITVFLVPVSVPLEEYYDLPGFNVQFPTEIILMLILLVVILKIFSGNPFSKKLLTHPITLAIGFYLVWMFITSLTSSMVLVSFKYLLAHLWFIAAFYLLATLFFQSKKEMGLYVWLFISTLMIVILSTMYKMYTHGWFNQQIAHIAARPFFKDHTSYGAVLAMILPFAIGFAFYRKNPPFLKLLSWFVAIFVFIALVLSYTRAAWISVGLALVVFIIIVLRIKLRFVLVLLAGLAVVLYTNRAEIIMTLERNHQDSSKEITKHIQSIYNIRSDVSNVERINRWKSALRMVKERPVFGWGPGTYMFQYAPYQISRDKTVMSTNFGIWGNAHSEYIGPLAESGILGTVSFLLIITTVFYTAFKNISKIRGKFNTRLILICATLGLVTYCIHGFLNNFLDTDKASALFWGYIAMIVAIDLKQSVSISPITDSATTELQK